MNINSKVVSSAVAAAVGAITLGASILQLTGFRLDTALALKIAVAVVGLVVAIVLGRRFSRAGGGD